MIVHKLRIAFLVAFALAAIQAPAQPFNPGQGAQNGGLNGNLQGGNFLGAQNGAPGQQGGGNNADFQSLMDLIISTVAPDSWAENGGGEAEVRPYVGGVYADAKGLLRRVKTHEVTPLGPDLQRASLRLASVRTQARRPDQNRPAQRWAAQARADSSLRYVSLWRLERELERRMKEKLPLDAELLTLAGLRRVQFALLLPPSRADEPADLVLAGPAGDWRVEGDGRIVSLDARGTLTGAVVRLDDLLTMMRRCWGNSGGPFGCSINPRRQALAAAQAYLAASASRPVQPGKRSEWLKGLRDAVGQQDIELFGVDPSCRVAGVLVEADHHMKLIGMGLEEGPPGVESYLERLATSRRSPAQSSGVLRWWFAMNYQAVRASPQADAFELVGPGAKVMSETEMLTVRGGRVPAGHADEFAEQFAADFSRHFGTLCQKYPVYSELRNVFDLAMVMEIAQQVREHDPRQWQPRLFLDARRLPLPQYTPARHVETVVNHRVVNRRRFVAGVSGGVWSDPRSVLKELQEPTERTGYGPMGEQPVTLPEMIPSTAWWWDADPPALDR